MPMNPSPNQNFVAEPLSAVSKVQDRHGIYHVELAFDKRGTYQAALASAYTKSEITLFV